MSLAFVPSEFDEFDVFGGVPLAPWKLLQTLMRRLAAGGRRQGRRLAGIVVPAVLLVAALTLTQLLGDVAIAEVVAAITGTSAATIAASLLFCILSYTALTGYDWFAASHVGLRVGYARIALASFLSYGFANSIGFALVIGGAVRLRIYRGQGATPAQVAYLTAICGLTFALSGGLVIGTAMLLAPSVVALALPLDPLVLQLFGAIGIGGVVVYLRWVGERPRSLCLRGVKLALPGVATTVGQLAVGAMDLVFAGTALYVLLPGDPAIGWAGFICLFSAAMTLGYLSHVPGGVGIFEALIVIALPDIPAGALLGSLVVYRCLYYLLPLAVASLLLGWFELRCGRLPPTGDGASTFRSPAG